MPSIDAVGTALPPYTLAQDRVKEFARAMFGDAFPDIDRLIAVYDNSEIECRHFCVPLEWFAREQSFEHRNDLYIENAIRLSTQATACCLENAGLRHEDIDYILFVSTTGISTPSIDAHLIERLPFRRTIKRLPIWGLGCAGGAASLSRAMEIARAVPTARILIVVTELCGLTFLRNDLGKSALIASSLFADGSAAVIVTGDQVPSSPSAPRLLASYTNTLRNSLDVMGWDIGNEGFRVMISRDIPTIVRTFMRESIQAFLAEQQLAMECVEHFIAHPGGAKVLDAYAESLGLPEESLRHTRAILRRCGNMSAVSVLFVLDRFMREIAAAPSAERQYGLACALGPGFASEQVLLQWNS
ncbi:MAG TPA: 3-oxoacyl-[acyl-carrier-protein] synthase III C-terminal domain-containing protein [Candidatus Kapabacteria bacterium]|nr:3-oxoacyl-[acyl-carrier-protein] synthase III C-terminal domain-containing protein [Candidatus Kapabacteria bacterium]